MARTSKRLIDCYLPAILILSLLCVHRQRLNKQIQRLDTYLRTCTMNEERKSSQLFTSTATPNSFQYETPKAFGNRVAPFQLDPCVPHFNDAGGYDWRSTPLVSFPAHTFSAPTPVDRGSFIPKLSEVNYIEGSVDKNWSSRNFSWTKKLEV